MDLPLESPFSFQKTLDLPYRKFQEVILPERWKRKDPYTLLFKWSIFFFETREEPKSSYTKYYPYKVNLDLNEPIMQLLITSSIQQLSLNYINMLLYHN